MPTKEYKIRVSKELPEVTSESVTAWLDQAIAQGGKLASDPGGGPVRISLSLDSEKVVGFANKKRERVVIALRRLIASNVKLDPMPEREESAQGKAEVSDLIPDRVLPRKLSYEAEDFLDFIRGMDKGLALVYRRAYKLKELKPAETPSEDRKLASALAECANRRSPAWMLANADLVRLGISSFRWSIAQTEDLDSRVRNSEKNPGLPMMQLREAVPAAQPPAPAPGAPAPAEVSAADVEAALDASVQQEGHF